MHRAKQPANIEKIHSSFSAQAKDFESERMNFSKQEYLDYTIRAIQARKTDALLDAAAGTGACGRSLSPLVASVVCLDATAAMLQQGRAMAEAGGLSNIRFVQGYVEQIPYPDAAFDIVITRLAFHHFPEMERPFMELHRVLKPGGKLVIIDMEAAEEDLRDREDRIETMRDPSHVKNRSRGEFAALYERYGYSVKKMEHTDIAVSLDAWMDLTQTPEKIRRQIAGLMEAELSGGERTGFSPRREGGALWFNQRWLLMLGVKGADKAGAPCKNPG